MPAKDEFPPREKKWKHLYTRFAKLVRAKQLGIDYPRVTEKKLAQQETATMPETKTNVLFVCSRNQWRSPTAEEIWRKHPRLSVRSAGTSPNARRKVSVEDIRWAHVICVMESKHKSRLLAEFTRLLDHKTIHVLDIPDDYQFMDPELVQMLEQSAGPLLGIASAADEPA